MEKLRKFECVCGYALGEIYRDAERITRLRVYRFAVAPKELFVLDVIADRVAFVMEDVNDGSVICSHCGASMPWLANKAAFDDMMRRRDLRRKSALSTFRG